MAVGLGTAYIEVRADLRRFPAELREKLRVALAEATAGLDWTGLEEGAGEAGRRAGERAADEFDRSAEPKMRGSGHRAARSWFSGLSGGFSALRVSFLPTVIALAVAIVAALGPAVAYLAAALPLALTGAIAGMASLMVATRGVGTALKATFAGDSRAAAEAMAKLAPAARDFVREVDSARTPFRALQQQVQQVFFTQLRGVLTEITTRLLPTLRAGLSSMAGDMAGLGAAISRAFIAGRGDLAGAFTEAHRAMVPLTAAMSRLVSIFLLLSRAAGPFLVQLTAGLAAATQRWDELLRRADSSGRLAAGFAATLEVLRQLRIFLGAVGELLGSIFAALHDAGMDSMGVLALLLLTVADFFRSAEGKQALVSIFTLLNAVLLALGRILEPLLPVLGQLAAGLGDQLITTVEQLTPGLVNLAQAAADLLQAADPLLPVIGALAEVLGPVVTMLTSSPELLAAAAGAWLAYEAATKIATAAQLAFDAAAAANPIGLIVIAIAALIAIIILIVAHWDTVKSATISAWHAIQDAAKAVWEWIKGIGSNIADWFSSVVAWFEALPGRILGFLLSLPGKLADLFGRAVLGIVEMLAFGLALVVGIFIKLPGWILNALSSLWSLLWDLFTTAWKAVGDAVVTGAMAVVDWIMELPGRFMDALTSLPGKLADFWRGLWRRAKELAIEGGSALIDWVKGLPGRLAGFFSGVGTSILGGLKSGINGVIGAVNRGIDRAAGLLHMNLPHIPLLARGAIVDRPTLAVVGERAREVVVPLSDPERARQLSDQSGLTGLLRRGLDRAVNVVVYATLGTSRVIEVLDQRIEQAFDDAGNAVANGVR